MQHAQATCEDFISRYWDPSDAIPKHERLRRAFTESIHDGYWMAGMRLPTEAELVRASPCGLGTVQRALRALVADRLVIRRQGSGTVVARLSRRLDEPWHIRFPDPDSPGSFLPVYTNVVSRTLCRERGPWSDEIGQDGQALLRIDRVFTVSDTLRLYAVFRALSDKFPELTHLPTADLDGTNFKTLIAQRYDLPVSKLKQSVRMTAPPALAVQHSDCQADRPALHLVFTAYSLKDVPVYHQEFFVPQTDMLLNLS